MTGHGPSDGLGVAAAAIGWSDAEMGESLTHRFATVVAALPDYLAVIGPDGHYTYAELDEGGNRIANAILDHIGPGDDPVAVVVANRASSVVALVGAMKAGRPTVAIHSGGPATALASITDAGCRLVVVAEGIDADTVEMPDGIPILVAADAADESASRPAVTTGPRSVARITFTSGSTGRPKGTMFTHGHLLDVARWTNEFYDLGPGDRFAFSEPIVSPPSANLMTCALVGGATVCLFDLRSEGLTELAAWMRRERITMTHSVVTILRRLLASLDEGEGFPDMRLWIVGGEALRRADAEAVFERVSHDCILRHSYGMTETDLVVRNEVTPTTLGDHTVIAVGRAVPGREITVCDADGNGVPEGEVGEIVVTSRFISPGYWRNEEATAAAFTFLDDGRIRYRTGDLGRFRDGMLELLGRVDDMVKVRGQRVVLADVEAALMDLPGVAEAATAAPLGPDGSPYLVGYIVPQSSMPAASKLRSALAHLPDQMIPTTFVAMDELPVSPGGKVLRSKLPMPDLGRASAGFEAPRSLEEEVVTSIMADALGVDRVGRDDDLFDLGLDSLHITDVAARVGKAFGTVVPPATLLAHPTAAGLAAAISGGGLASVQDVLVPVRAGDGRPPFFCVHGGNGGTYFLQPMSRYLDPGQGLYGLQAEGFDGTPGPYRPVEDIAARYLEAVRAVRPHGPYLLGGFSFGGKVACEMARLLATAGEQVALLVVLDTELPLPGLGARRSWRRRIERFLGMDRRLGATHVGRGLWERATRPLKRLAIWIQLKRGKPLPDRFGLRRFFFLRMRFHKAYIAYQPGPIDARLVVIGVEGTTEEHRTTWTPLARNGIDVHEVAADHEGLVQEPHIGEVSQLIQHYLDEAIDPGEGRS